MTNTISPNRDQHHRQTAQLFVAHSAADAAWVDGVLLPSLGLGPGEVITPADFRLGEARTVETERAVQAARNTVLVLSPAFLADEWSVFAELLSGHGAASGEQRLIPLLLHECDLPLRIEFRVVLDCTDEADWPKTLSTLRKQLGASSPETSQLACPYPGMAPFRPQDAALFFGREQEADDVVRRLTQHSLVLVIGPSGSGKSSLVHAGVLPLLARERLPRPVILVRPGGEPLTALLDGLRRLVALPDSASALVLVRRAGVDGGAKPLIVVDQLEECFTGRPAQSGAFLAELDLLRRSGACSVLAALRADFTSELMTCALWPLEPGERVEVVPLRGEALRSAIVRPAQELGVHLEPVLVERLVHDTQDEPGALPLVQEALVLLWERRFQRYLSLRSYESLGRGELSGVAVALATRADATLAAMAPGQRRTARQILLRLIQLGEGRTDNRRRQTVAALCAGMSDRPLFTSTLTRLAERRLIVLGADEDAEIDSTTVDLAHEAMITGWPQLHTWVEESRSDELLRRRVERDARDWWDGDHERGSVYRGRRLSELIEWIGRHPDELGPVARALLTASLRRRRLARILAGLTIAALLAAVAWLALPLATDAARRQQAIALGPTAYLAGGDALLGQDYYPTGQRYPVHIPAFRIDVHEVSNRQYRLCVEAGACSEPNEPFGDSSYARAANDPSQKSLPVRYVTAYQAARYCSWVGRLLPTAEQWERAAGGLTGRAFPWGDTPPTAARANTVIDAPVPIVPTGPVPVDDARFAAGRTPEGVEHLIGNVAEWTSTEVSAQPDSPGGSTNTAAATTTDSRRIWLPAWGRRWDGHNLVAGLLFKGGTWASAQGVGYSNGGEANASSQDLGLRCAAEQ